MNPDMKNEDIALTVSLEIERSRRTNGKGLAQVAQASGMSTQKLSRLINNQQIFRLDELINVANALGLTALDIVQKADIDRRRFIEAG